MEEKDREIWVGENRLYLSDDNILYWKIVGEVNEQNVIAIYQAAFKILNSIKEKVNVLVDLNEAGKASHEARKLGDKYLESEKFGKIAYFGLNPVTRVLASFFMGVSKKKDMRFFKAKEEAVAWLKERDMKAYEIPEQIKP